MRAAAAQLSSGGTGWPRRYAGKKSGIPGDRTAAGVRSGSRSAPVLDSARTELSLCSDRARPVGAYVWVAQRVQSAAQSAFLSDAARVAQGGARDRGVAIHQERNREAAGHSG